MRRPSKAIMSWEAAVSGMGSLKKTLAFPLTIVITAVLTACALPPASDGGKPLPSEAGECLHPSRWQISFQRSGGFAGQTVNLYLSNRGEMKVVNQDQNIEINTIIPPADVDWLEAQLASICAGGGERQNPSCRDCFVYSLEVEINGKKYTAIADDTTLGASKAKPLFEALIALLNQTLQAQP
jgi:hypothetical protein